MLGLVWIGLVDHIGGIGLDYVGFVWIGLDHLAGSILAAGVLTGGEEENWEQ